MAKLRKSGDDDYRLRLRLSREHPMQAKLIEYLEEAARSRVPVSNIAALLMTEGFQARIGQAAVIGDRERDALLSMPLPSKMTGPKRKRGTLAGRAIDAAVGSPEQSGLTAQGGGSVEPADQTEATIVSENAPEETGKLEHLQAPATKPAGQPPAPFKANHQDEERFLGLFNFSMPDTSA